MNREGRWAANEGITQVSCSSGIGGWHCVKAKTPQEESPYLEEKLMTSSEP